MVVEERIYTLKVGKLAEQMKAYEEFGLAAQKEILGNLVGYYYTEIGALNTIIHMWAYEDLNDRAARRAKLMGDERFKVYLGKVLPLLERQENRIMIPAPFFEKTLRAMMAAGKAQG